MEKHYFFHFKDCDLKWVIALFNWVYRARQRFHCLHIEEKTAACCLPPISTPIQREEVQTSFCTTSTTRSRISWGWQTHWVVQQTQSCCYTLFSWSTVVCGGEHWHWQCASYRHSLVGPLLSWRLSTAWHLAETQRTLPQHSECTPFLTLLWLWRAIM